MTTTPYLGRYKIQQTFGTGGCWFDLWFETYFDTKEEAEQEWRKMAEEHHAETGEVLNPELYRIVIDKEAPRFSTGYRFKLDGLQHGSPGQTLDMMVTYHYHNGHEHKYHCGLIVAKDSEPVPAMYDGCRIHYFHGFKIVDYCTASEEEILRYQLP